MYDLCDMIDDTSKVKEIIRQFLLDNAIERKITGKLTDSTKLRTSGILDSLGTLGLVTFIEKEFELELEPHELGIEAFDSIDEVTALIERKRSAES
jgi:acyl carrier protein